MLIVSLGSIHIMCVCMCARARAAGGAGRPAGRPAGRRAGLCRHGSFCGRARFRSAPLVWAVGPGWYTRTRSCARGCTRVPAPGPFTARLTETGAVLFHARNFGSANAGAFCQTADRAWLRVNTNSYHKSRRNGRAGGSARSRRGPDQSERGRKRLRRWPG